MVDDSNKNNHTHRNFTIYYKNDDTKGRLYN